MNLSHNKKIIKTIAFFVISSIGTISILGSTGPKHQKKIPKELRMNFEGVPNGSEKNFLKLFS